MTENVICLISMLLLPLIMMITGLLIWRFPPAYKGLGYSTSRSESSEAAWYTAQAAWGKIALFSHILTLILTVIAGIIPIIKDFPEEHTAVVVMVVTAVQIAVLLAGFVATEIILSKRFDKNGNPK